MRTQLVILAVLIVTGCNSKPSDNDIKRKVLIEYICFETAKVNDLKILDTKDAQSIGGNEAYQFNVSGEVEWPDGCSEFGGKIPPGGKERFEKTVFLVKDDDGVWQ